MEQLSIPAEIRTPELQFNWSTGTFTLRGESYPEDVRKFYDAPVKLFREWVAADCGTPILFEFDLIYFNSSTAKVLLELFSTIEEAATKGRYARVIWHCASDDDNSRELGQDLGAELKAASFQLCEAVN